MQLFFWRKSAPLSETRPVPWVDVLRLLLFFFCGNFRQKKNSLLGFLKPFGSSFVLFFTFSHLFWCCCCCCCCCCRGPKKWRAKFNDHFLKKWIEFEFLCWFDYSGQFFVDFFKGLFIIKKKKFNHIWFVFPFSLERIKSIFPSQRNQSEDTNGKRMFCF